jgi:hypothetical protein
MIQHLSKDQRRGLIGSALLSLMILSIVGAYYLWGESFHARILYATFVNLLVVVGLQVFTGNANITGFSHAAFMGVAAYAAAICVTPIAMKAISLPVAPGDHWRFRACNRAGCRTPKWCGCNHHQHSDPSYCTFYIYAPH